MNHWQVSFTETSEVCRIRPTREGISSSHDLLPHEREELFECAIPHVENLFREKFGEHKTDMRWEADACQMTLIVY